MSKKIKSKKLAKGLCLYIIELESFRKPVSIGILPYSLSTFFELISNPSKRNYFIRNNPNLHQRTQKLRVSYFKNMIKLDRNILLPFFSYLLIIVFIWGITITITNIFDFNIFNGLLFLVIILLPSIYLFLVWMSTRNRRFFGEKYDDNLKKALQDLIDYGLELIKKENLNPEEYPLKLRHNDYKGLEYEIKGKNKYIGVFKNEI